tara:strand:- start:93 stop:380 length:288 start_codon:yes stop_codon:yes gene_type:complete
MKITKKNVTISYLKSKSTCYPSYILHIKTYSKKKEIKGPYDCEDEKRFSNQLNSGENYDELNRSKNEKFKEAKKREVKKTNNISMTNSRNFYVDN